MVHLPVPGKPLIQTSGFTDINASALISGEEDVCGVLSAFLDGIRAEMDVVSAAEVV